MPESDDTHEKEVVILGLSSQILEDTLFPVSFHLIPIFDLTVFDRVIQVIGLRVCECFVSDVEIEIVYTSFRREVT